MNPACSFYGHTEFVLRLGNKSRMSREVPVRFREGLGVKFPRATRLLVFTKTSEAAQRVARSRPISRENSSWWSIIRRVASARPTASNS